MLGHDAPPTSFWRENLITEAPLTECPLRTLLRASAAERDELDRHVTTYYPAYRDGHLLVEGGVADQPARYLAIVRQLRESEETQERKYLETIQER